MTVRRPRPATRALDALWQSARARWSLAVELKRPLQTRTPGAVAYIDLRTRQTWVDFKGLRARKLEHCLEALLAHEVGHHIRYPHTMVDAVRFTRFLRQELCDLASIWGLPALVSTAQAGRLDFLLNLVFDLLINTDLKAAYQDAFVDLYRGLSAEPAEGPPDALFGWYLGLYEEGWYLPPGTLVGPRTEAHLRGLLPDWRAACRVCFQHLMAHRSDRCLQIVRFLIDLRPLLESGVSETASRASLEGDRPFRGDLTPDEMRRVLQPLPGEAGARRWRRELGAGRLPGAVGPPRAPARKPTGPFGSAGVPGVGEGDPVRSAQDVLQGLCAPVEVARTTYARLARQAAIDVPGSQRVETPDTPGPTEPWAFGDRVEEIDWMATLSRSGVPVPGLNLEKRTWLPEDPQPGLRVAPWIEMYIDCSGSMPDPVQHFNHAILAGFILADAALRHGGRVRVVPYSHQARPMPDFVSSERHAHAGLLTYVGGGTRFPWDILHDSTERYRRVAAVHRVIVSDTDFFYNFEQPDVVKKGFTSPQLTAAALAGAVRPPGSLIVLLDAPADAPPLAALCKLGARALSVGAWSNLPSVARDLVKVLFPSADAH